MKFEFSKFSRVIIHRGNIEPAERIPTIKGRITDAETDEESKNLWDLQANQNLLNKVKNETKQNTSKESNNYNSLK